jgi:hypothetical protein
MNDLVATMVAVILCPNPSAIFLRYGWGIYNNVEENEDLVFLRRDSIVTVVTD